MDNQHDQFKKKNLIQNATKIKFKMLKKLNSKC